jgi:hypothetical protein
MVDQGLTQHARLQTIITCGFFPCHSTSLIVTVELLVAKKMSFIKAIHVFYITMLQSESGRLLCCYLSTHILNGSTTMPCSNLRQNLTLFGQFLYWDMKVCIINFPSYSESITDQIIAGSLPTMMVQ